MKKIRIEFILLVIIIPILAYVGWQTYNSYFRPVSVDIEQEEPALKEEEQPPKATDTQEKQEYKEELKKTEQEKEIRDPLRHSLPVKIIKPEPKKEQPGLFPERITDQQEKGITDKIKESIIQPKPVILPTFAVSAIVWGEADPRAIIDDKVYKIGDFVKGAQITQIDSEGVHMLYEGQQFTIKIKLGG